MLIERVRQTLPVMAAFVMGCVLTGCDRGETVPVDPASPQSYMNDKPFMEKVNAREKKGNAIRARHMKLKKAYDELKAKEPSSPRLKEMEAEMKALQEEFQANRREMLSIVRERITPTAPKK